MGASKHLELGQGSIDRKRDEAGSGVVVPAHGCVEASRVGFDGVSQFLGEGRSVISPLSGADLDDLSLWQSALHDFILHHLNLVSQDRWYRGF